MWLVIGVLAWAALVLLLLAFNRGAHLHDDEWENPGKERVGLNREDAFPPEVLALRRDRGVPLPTWYSGPLYPTDNGDEAQSAFESYLREVRERDARARARHAARKTA